jgi:hypothetical protein
MQAAPFLHVPLYERLANHLPTGQEREAAADFLRANIFIDILGSVLCQSW